MERAGIEENKLLPPFPNGWYAVSRSNEVQPGRVRSFRFMGQDFVLFRTVSGAVSVMDAYCPHLGAHLGYGGTVEGECIRCPFHGFQFDVHGNCTVIPYGTRPPPKAQARVLPVREVDGFIFAFHDNENKPPAWNLPELDTHGWSPWRPQMWTLRAHPQETTENSVDLGHFAEVHHYAEVETIKPLVTEGARLNATYAMTRGDGLLGRPIRAEFEIQVYGLGFSLVHAHVLQYDLHARFLVLATPAERQQITLRTALSVRKDVDPRRIHPLLALAPRTLLYPILAHNVFAGFAHDLQQDFHIWEHKRYVQPPILAEGDGPIGRYRLWCRQFYRGADAARI